MTFKSLITNYINDTHTFYIVPFGSDFMLYVMPEYRRNGTQSFDGHFPRFYKSPKFAKAALTRMLGKPEQWIEIN